MHAGRVEACVMLRRGVTRFMARTILKIFHNFCLGYMELATPIEIPLRHEWVIYTIISHVNYCYLPML